MSVLITPTELSSLMEEQTVVILDASIDFQIPSETEKDKHNLIPGSIRFDYDKVFCDPDSPLPHMMPSEQRFNQLAQQIGINQDSLIVVYDNSGTFASPRAWWMFKAMGHKQVRVLDGGLTAWKQAGLPTVTDYQTGQPQGDFCGKLDSRFFVDAEAVSAEIDNPLSLTVDARGLARFKGEVPEPRAGVRSGHIPNSVCMPFANLMDGHQLKPLQELSHIFSTQIDATKQHYIFSCGSGVTAAIVLLAAHLCGYQNLSVYDGSWTEWGQSTLPIEV